MLSAIHGPCACGGSCVGWSPCPQGRPHPSALCHEFLVLFSLEQAVPGAGSAWLIPGMDGGIFLCSALHPGAICSCLGWLCRGLLQRRGFGSGTARVGVPYGAEPELGEGNFHISMEVRTGVNSRGCNHMKGGKQVWGCPEAFPAVAACAAGRGCLCREHREPFLLHSFIFPI